MSAWPTTSTRLWRMLLALVANTAFCSTALLLSAASGQTRPNVVLIVSDDQRPDTIGALGESGKAVIRTPNLDQLARRGLSFLRAVSPNPICTPARAEIMTGCSGFRNGVLDFGGRDNSELSRWAQTFRTAGYDTAYVGKWHNRGRPADWGYAECRGLFAGGGGRFVVDQVDFKNVPVTGYRGWIFQTEEGQLFPEEGVGLTPDISRKFADAAISFLSEPRPQPFFVHVNFTAPHDPLFMPPGFADEYPPAEMPLPRNFLPVHPFDHGNFAGRDELQLPWPRTHDVVRRTLAYYYSVIADLDQQIGRLLKALRDAGLEDNTLVIFTSDHGLAVGSHGLSGKQNMYEHTIGVPLLIAGPQVPGGRRTTAQVYLRELFPTMCEMAGLEIPPSVEGKSFAAVLRGEADSHHEQVFAYFRDSQRMIRTDRWKLVYYPLLPRYQLFDLQQDPYERTNLAADPAYADTFAELRRRLEQWRAGHEPR
jgi:arylsulfatase A-like enzyme